VIALTLVGYQLYQKISAPEFEPASIEKMAFSLPEKPSIAVLPFDNLNNDPELDYISDGITENVITVLSSSPRLFIIDRAPSSIYKDKPVKIKQISEELGVRYILQGSVLKSGDKVRISTRLSIPLWCGLCLFMLRVNAGFKGVDYY